MWTEEDLIAAEEAIQATLPTELPPEEYARCRERLLRAERPPPWIIAQGDDKRVLVENGPQELQDLAVILEAGFAVNEEGKKIQPATLKVKGFTFERLKDSDAISDMHWKMILHYLDKGGDHKRTRWPAAYLATQYRQTKGGATIWKLAKTPRPANLRQNPQLYSELTGKQP